MIFRETELPGVFVIEPELHEDQRGFFAPHLVSARVHRTRARSAPCAVLGLVQPAPRHPARHALPGAPPTAKRSSFAASGGAIWDVALDLRPASPTFRQHIGLELTADNRMALYIPQGLAHGFQTLEDDTEVLYQMSEFYAPEVARGIRFDDPAFAISWPLEPFMLTRDRTYPDFAARSA